MRAQTHVLDFHDFAGLLVPEAFAGKPFKHRGTLLKKSLQCGQKKRAAEHSRAAEIKESRFTGSKLRNLHGAVAVEFTDLTQGRKIGKRGKQRKISVIKRHAFEP